MCDGEGVGLKKAKDFRISNLIPEAFGELTNRYASWIQQYYNALAKSEAPVVMVHDNIVWTAGAFIHPDWYRRFVFPSYKKYFVPLREAGKLIMYTSDGKYNQFIDDIAAVGVNGFFMAVGNHIPANTPVDNVLYYNEVYEELSRR